MIRTAKPPSIHSLDDPLSAILRPSPTESEQDRRERLRREADAKKISDRIDEELNLEKERYKKKKQDVKVCFLIVPFIAACALSQLLSSSYCLAKLNPESQPSKSSSSFSTAQTHSKRNASHGDL